MQSVTARKFASKRQTKLLRRRNVDLTGAIKKPDCLLGLKIGWVAWVDIEMLVKAPLYDPRAVYGRDGDVWLDDAGILAKSDVRLTVQLPAMPR